MRTKNKRKENEKKKVYFLFYFLGVEKNEKKKVI